MPFLTSTDTLEKNLRTIPYATRGRRQGKHQQADRLYVRAIKASEGVLGLDHPDVINMLRDRAGLLHEQVRGDCYLQANG